MMIMATLFLVACGGAAEMEEPVITGA